MNRRRARKSPPPPAPSSKPKSAAASSAASAISGRRLWLFRLAAIFLAPIFLLVAFDLALRVAGYGYPTHFFLERKINGHDCYVENERFGWRFFGRDMARAPFPFVIPKVKPPDTTRIFVFGESAAYGDPQPEFGLPRMLQALFSLRFPNRHFEVINTAMTAINSHVILPIARDCASQDGDYWVIYMGNNEVVGPFGSGTVFGPKAPPCRLVRLSLAFKATRLGQLLDNLRHSLQKRSARDSVWGGMPMFVKNHVLPNDPRMATVYANFQENLGDIVSLGLRHGARVILSTVARNVRNCAPFGSDHRSDLSPADHSRWDGLFNRAVADESSGDLRGAVDSFRQAAAVDSTPANLHYRWAQCDLALGDQPGASQEFIQACDDDTLRFRSDTRINDIIRDAYHAHQAQGVRFIDAQAVLAADSPAHIVGDDFLYEHVHLNFDGNYRLAVALAQQIMPTNSDWPSQADCARRLAYTDYNRSEGLRDIMQRLVDQPYTSQFDHAEEYQRFKAKCDAVVGASSPQALEQDKTLCEKSAAQWRGDWLLWQNLSLFQGKTGDLAGAVASIQKITELLPQSADTWKAYGIALGKMDRTAEAKTALEKSLRIDPGNPQTIEVIAEIDLAHHDYDAAKADFERILKIEPFYGPAHLGLGKIYDHAGQRELAAAEYQKSMAARVNSPGSFNAMAKFFFDRGDYTTAATNFFDSLHIDPSDPETHVNLGRTLEKLQRWDEARAHYAEAVRLDPNFAAAHFCLGMAYGRLGDDQTAMAQFAEAARLNPNLLEARLDLGISLYKLHRDADSRHEFQEVLKGNPTNQTALAFLHRLDHRDAQPSDSAAPVSHP